MICNARLHGFAATKKIWVQLHVRSVRKDQEVRRESALNNLCLVDDDELHSCKRMIQSLVLSHRLVGRQAQVNVPQQLQDFADNKGQGLVILLHGTSGVGKTLTAEIIAQATAKPLLKVSVADIGTDVTKVESRLNMWFDLATTWGALLLFDEADVLLEARATEDNLVRNAIVSVFLKILEYYEGILFLTSNRIKTFDIAVQSRVNLGIHFDDLTDKQRKRIFRRFIEGIDERQIKNRDYILQWADGDFRDKFNGREIRNMISSALALARHESRSLELRDIKVIRESKRVFKDYLHDQTIRAKERNE